MEFLSLCLHYYLLLCIYFSIKNFSILIILFLKTRDLIILPLLSCQFWFCCMFRLFRLCLPLLMCLWIGQQDMLYWLKGPLVVCHYQEMPFNRRISESVSTLWSSQRPFWSLFLPAVGQGGWRSLRELIFFLVGKAPIWYDQARRCSRPAFIRFFFW